ncbi:hypothetical protein J2Y46_001569 [Microbacterium sp. BE35]|uniref:Uncharacterized protein n=1 Tax=Microbacterium trichothecenolyticum TaxID=69370 RepID=A0A0M2H8G3_MICTR|nr:hypothetical protein RS82_03477 [Microbacterium trichothecenolyticum]MDR7188746.1 hypothetical protein [Microbacterium sp. BE35]
MTPHPDPHFIGRNPDATAHTAAYPENAIDLQCGGVVT